MPKWERLMFWLAYLRGRGPWDSNVTPPELINTVEGPDALPPSRALDLGCGTGTNVIYLVTQGWEAFGVDFVDRAIREAREKAQEAGVEARFYAGDVTRLEAILELTGTFDLALDIGCFHSLQSEGRKRYANGLVDRLRPGATYLLYAWGPHQGRSRGRGVTPAEVKAIFTPHLKVLRVQQGEERGWPSAWYWLRHGPQK